MHILYSVIGKIATKVLREFSASITDPDICRGERTKMTDADEVIHLC